MYLFYKKYFFAEQAELWPKISREVLFLPFLLEVENREIFLAPMIERKKKEERRRGKGGGGRGEGKGGRGKGKGERGKGKGEGGKGKGELGRIRVFVLFVLFLQKVLFRGTGRALA